MGKPTGFLEHERTERPYEPVAERLKHWHEFVRPLPENGVRAQGARCMDCGIPFCHNGCPVNNQIPDWNHLVYEGDWQRAAENLHSTNNFPEMTGRVCPAPCEESCTLNLNTFVRPVAIKTIECAVADRARQEGWVQPLVAEKKTSKSVAVVGSGPAGMACAQQLARGGHDVTVYEKADRIGGLLRYGIPDFKMEKHLIDARVEQMRAEGVVFKTGVHVGKGKDVSAHDLARTYDAVVMAGGAENPRDLLVPGRELNGVHFAMDFLPQQNKRVAGDTIPAAEAILAKGKRVVVIGGGDTGSDCIGTSIRQGATHVRQLEIVPQPPKAEDKPVVWPDWPRRERISSSQEEVEFRYGEKVGYTVGTHEIEGDGEGNVKRVHCHLVEWTDRGPKRIDGTERTYDAELVLLAMGFASPRAEVVEDLGFDPTVKQRDPQGKVIEAPENYKTSLANVFAAGDMRRGQSLVVWAIREGRQCAHAVDEFLMGESVLPR